MEEEQLEHIPWSALVAEHRDERNRTILLAAGVLVALVVGFLGARLLGGSGAATTVSLDGPPGVAAVDETLPATPVTPTSNAPETGPATAAGSLTAPLSEADLMALVPDELSRAAAARAEWFVTDLFTSDLDPEGSAPIRAALPAGISLPVLPHDTATGVSYVEWARAFRVEPIGAGVYLVDVMFRALAAPEDGLFSRTGIRAVEVTVRATPDGETVVLDLPTPIDPPPTAGSVAAPLGTTPAPDPVLGNAVTAAASWGFDPRVVSSGDASGLFRVVVSVADEVGNRWPLVFWYDASGAAARPPN